MKNREYYFDNGKFILIFLVVFGHLIQSFIKDHEVIHTIYKVIYTFHMPAFILISGFFAKGYSKKGYLKKVAKKLIIPYLIFQLIYSVYYYYLFSKSTFVVDPFDPHWSLWFLISLFFWNILLILFTKLKVKFSLFLALCIGLGIGYVDWISNYLSLSRTFVFFPLFLLGFYMRKEDFYQLIKPSTRILSLFVFAVVFLVFYMNPEINYQWLLGSKPYDTLDAANLSGAITRLGFYGLSLIMIISFFSLVPRKQYFFTTLGKNTLYVYLLHGFFVRLFRESNVQDYFNSIESFLLLGIISLIITVLLSSRLVTSFTQPLIELSTSKLKQLTLQMLNIFRAYRKRILNN